MTLERLSEVLDNTGHLHVLVFGLYSHARTVSVEGSTLLRLTSAALPASGELCVHCVQHTHDWDSDSDDDVQQPLTAAEQLEVFLERLVELQYTHLHELRVYGLVLTERSLSLLATALTSEWCALHTLVLDNVSKSMDPVGAAGLEVLFAALGGADVRLKRLEVSFVSSTPPLRDALAAMLATNTSIRELYLTAMSLPAEAITRATSLRFLEVCRMKSSSDMGFAAALAVLLESSTVLDQLTVQACGLESRFSTLCDAIATSRSLRAFELDDHHATPEQLGQLAAAVLAADRLCCLRLSGCVLTVEHARALVPLLEHSSLTELSLAWCGLCTDELQVLVPALAANTSLKTLNLRSNRFGSDAAALLGPLLASSSRLEELDLTYVGLTDASMVALAKPLCAHPTLQTLLLSNNDLNDSSVRALAEHLGSTTCQLRTLNLLGNNLTQAAVQSLADALQSNKWLEDLAIHYSKFSIFHSAPERAAVADLVAAIMRHPRLHQLDFKRMHTYAALENPFDETQTHIINERLAWNRLRTTDGMATFLCGLFIGQHDTALRRFASHPMFEVNNLTMVFHLLDGKSHTIDFRARASRLRD